MGFKFGEGAGHAVRPPCSIHCARNILLKELPKCKKMWLGIIMHNA